MSEDNSLPPQGYNYVRDSLDAEMRDRVAAAKDSASGIPEGYYDLQAYQDFTGSVTQYPQDTLQIELAYLGLGISGEAGEVVEKIKKFVRGDYDNKPEEIERWRDGLCKEMGDVLWYIARLGAVLEIPLEKMFDDNRVKLQDRFERDVVKGNGDYR